MWISRKRWEALEKRVADLETESWQRREAPSPYETMKDALDKASKARDHLILEDQRLPIM